MFDPDKFGEAMGQAIREAVAPLQSRIEVLQKELDVVSEKLLHELQVASMTAPVAGPAGAPGKDAEPVDQEVIIKEVLSRLSVPKDGADGIDGAPGRDGVDGEKGADGLGLAGAMIDRDGALQITFTNGEVKSLGVVVGKDGENGSDGVSLDAFEMEYLPESHEIAIKAAVGARVKELRYPAGGIRPAGYWREGTKAQAGEAWVHDGSTWYAKKATASKPESRSEDWIIGARKGRDGETVVKTINAGPPAPIKLQG
jgi:hypothetical protein